MPRTGSSRISQICNDNGICYISEIFAPGNCKLVSNKLLSKRIKEHLTSKNLLQTDQKFDRSFLLRRYDVPEEVSLPLKEHPSTFIIEIFPKHLKLPHLLSLMKHCDDLILILRPLIDSYISLVKAREFAKIYGKPQWGRVDTTEIKPSIDAMHFLIYIDDALEYYHLAISSIHTRFSRSPRRLTKLDYQTWSALDAKGQEEYVMNALKIFSPRSKNLNYKSVFPRARRKSELLKQDNQQTGKPRSAIQFSLSKN